MVDFLLRAIPAAGADADLKRNVLHAQHPRPAAAATNHDAWLEILSTIRFSKKTQTHRSSQPQRLAI
jgi:hypothetical protein